MSRKLKHHNHFYYLVVENKMKRQSNEGILSPFLQKSRLTAISEILKNLLNLKLLKCI